LTALKTVINGNAVAVTQATVCNQDSWYASKLYVSCVKVP